MKHKPTMDDYRRAGTELHDLNALALRTDIWIENVFGKKYRFSENSNRLNRVRSSLEDAMFADFPDATGTYIFYPAPTNRPKKRSEGQDMETIDINRMPMRPADQVYPERRERMAARTCVFCKKPITGFRDELSEREYRVSGMCQECQDRVF